ncbi:tumor necrosis factor receptor superfamily member 6 isoform X2 [Pogona vitticeps]
MIKTLLLCLLLTACGLTATGPSHNNDSVPRIHRVYNKLTAVKRVSKRNLISCHENTEYLFNTSLGVLCCESCPPGYVAENVGCTKENPKTSCKKCTLGKEYMDHYNYNTKCLRCRGCDEQHGMEIENNCTINQNTKCKCKTDFFCDSAPCHHCAPCDSCANGRVLEPCTDTKNTKCEETGESRQHFIIIGVIILLVLVIVVVFLLRKKRNNQQKKHTISTKHNIEMVPLKYPDIDLSSHIADIAEEMNLEDVLRLVRKLGVLSSRIEVVKSDNQNNAAEAKIKLLELWYQEKGITGAYGALITTLRKLHLRSAADKIEQKMSLLFQNNENLDRI